MERRESGALRQEGRSGGERNSFGGGRSYGVTLIQIHSEKHKGTGKANRERVSRYSLEERLDQDCNTKWQGLSLWQRCSHKETFFQFADEQRRQAAKCTENGPGVLKQTTHSPLQVWKIGSALKPDTTWKVNSAIFHVVSAYMTVVLDTECSITQKQLFFFGYRWVRFA